MEQKIKQKLGYLGQALDRLNEMAIEPVDAKRAQIDSTIQRFKFCFELFWKALKVILEDQGEKTAYPKEVLQAAYRGGLIKEEVIWISMLQDRNETSHVYDQDAANRIYDHIKTTYIGVLNSSYESLCLRYPIS